MEMEISFSCLILCILLLNKRWTNSIFDFRGIGEKEHFSSHENIHLITDIHSQLPELALGHTGKGLTLKNYYISFDNESLGNKLKYCKMKAIVRGNLHYSLTSASSTWAVITKIYGSSLYFLYFIFFFCIRNVILTYSERDPYDLSRQFVSYSRHLCPNQDLSLLSQKLVFQPLYRQVAKTITSGD